MFVFAVACREVRNVSRLKAWLLVNPALAKISIFSVKQGIETVRINKFSTLLLQKAVKFAL